ncbi:acyl-CoA synthetase [soil metagenome]
MSIITTARDHPNKPATIMAGSGAVTSFAELLAEAETLARVLRSKLDTGDRVAMICANEAGYLAAAWAARRAGVYFVPVNWHLTFDEADYIVRNSDAKAVIASASLGALATRIVADNDALALRLSIGGTIDGFVSVEDACAAVPAIALPDGPDGNFMFYSSGTTGRPKGILRALGDSPFGAPTVGEAMLKGIFALDEETVLLIPAPLYHAAPMGWSQAAQGLGGTVVVMEKFDAEGLLAAVEKYRVTHINCVPIHLIRLLRLPEEVRRRYDLSSLRHVVHAAAPCPPDVKRAMIEWLGPVVEEFYSASEAAGFCTVTSEEWLRKPGTVGRPLVGGVRVIGEDGGVLPPGEPGLLYFEATPQFVYHNDVEKTEGFFDAEGWGCNGDIGWVDEDGYLFLADRKSNMIISGGVNIYPQEVENHLMSHPAIADVAVFGVPNAEYGEEVKAVVELRPDAGAVAGDGLAEELITFCRDKLAGFKCPRTVDFIERLPRHENGKLLKRELKARYWG